MPKAISENVTRYFPNELPKKLKEMDEAEKKSKESARKDTFNAGVGFFKSTYKQMHGITTHSTGINVSQEQWDNIFGRKVRHGTRQEAHGSV